MSWEHIPRIRASRPGYCLSCRGAIYRGTAIVWIPGILMPGAAYHDTAKCFWDEFFRKKKEEKEVHKG